MRRVVHVSARGRRHVLLLRLLRLMLALPALQCLRRLSSGRHLRQRFSNATDARHELFEAELGWPRATEHALPVPRRLKANPVKLGLQHERVPLQVRPGEALARVLVQQALQEALELGGHALRIP